jgi:transaldolase
MIREDGISGVTSNPTIFEKAVSAGRITTPAGGAGPEGASPEAAYQKIVVEDIRAAADVLRPVYDATKGEDERVAGGGARPGARDKATSDRARELFRAVGRPNVMIKIPATREGLPAVGRRSPRASP